MIGPFYVGQVPKNPLAVEVRDRGSNSAEDLSGYTSVEFVLIDPSGTAVQTGAGTAQIVDGQIQYAWPETSLFSQVGDYQFQFKLLGDTAVDYTIPETIEVKRALGG